MVWMLADLSAAVNVGHRAEESGTEVSTVEDRDRIECQARSLPEIFKPVEGEEVCVVVVMCAAQPVVVRSPADSNYVSAVEEPIDVLEPMFDGVGVFEQNASYSPSPQVGGACQGQCISDTGWFAFALVGLSYNAGNAPVLTAFGVESDRELFGAAGEIDETGGRIEIGLATVVAYSYHGNLFGAGRGIDPEHVDYGAVRCNHGIAFEPTAKSAVQPVGIACEAVA